MPPSANALMPWVIVSLGILGVILSFLVPDQKKSKLSLGLAGAIIVIGLFSFVSESISRYRWNRRIREIQQQRQTDLEELRQRLKDGKAAAPAAPIEAPKKK